jgi:hypothetical protein
VIAGRRLPAVALAVPAFLVACTVGMGGLATSKYPQDVTTYARYGRLLMLGGQIPYHDFYFEYPPGAVPVFALPALLWNAHYHFAFKLLMALCGALIVVVAAAILAALRADRRRTRAALGAIVVAPAALGPLFLNRYDAAPALLVAAALLALLRGRERLAFAALGLGFAMKLYPAVIVPLALVRVWRTKGRRAALVALGIGTGVVAAVFAFFVAVGFGGVGFSFWTQAKRHLQIESLGASFLLAADKLGLYRSHWIAGKPSSTDLGGRLPDLVGTASSALVVAAVVAVALAYARGRESDERLVTATAAAVGATVVLGKVLSPQYLIWLVPLVPLLDGTTTLLFVAAMGLTPVEFFLGDLGLRSVNWVVWVLLLRNLLLLAIVALLVRRLRARTAA